MDDFLFMTLMFIAIFAVAFLFMGKKNQGGTSTVSNSSSSQATVRTDDERNQMKEDIKYTQTSRCIDEIDILKELNATSPGYRQYCELVGKTQASGGVTAPYSNRKVAYYDVRCYRVEDINGMETETLVAQEKSVDPFWFSDGTTETPIYLDLESFGTNTLLVNSCNHIEGPTSNFAKAFQANSRPDSSATAMAAVAHAHTIGQGVVTATGNLLHHLGTSLRKVQNRLSNGLIALAPKPALAFAGAAGACDVTSYAQVGSVTGAQRGATRSYEGGHGPFWDGGGGFGGGGFGDYRGFGGGYGGPHGGMPHDGIPGLDSFLGGGNPMGGAPFGVPGGPGAPRPHDNDGADVLVGMTLGALLGSLASQDMTGGSQNTQGTFRGYRLVENIVPLNYQVYCIGELYMNGPDVHMGRSVSPEHTTSFFATKPEAEVLASL